MIDSPGNIPPARFHLPPVVSSLAFAAFIGVLFWSMSALGIRLGRLIDGLPAAWSVAGEMMPPQARDWPQFWRFAQALLATFQIGLVGTAIGIVLSLPIALMAAWNHSPHWLVAVLVRGLVTFCRSVPDLVWALFFVVIVGPGAFAGMLAIIVDTIGYCGRFYAESMEEVDPAPGQALTAIGAGNVGVATCATIPAALPAMTGHSLFAFEKGIRSSIVLGVVGAGGIGVEIKVAFDMFQFQAASLLILMVFILVLGVEQVSTHLRRQIIGRTA